MLSTPEVFAGGSSSVAMGPELMSVEIYKQEAAPE